MNDPTQSNATLKDSNLGTITSIASGKGGTGKTFYAVSLAAVFGSLGQRTLLIDGDLGLANVDVHLGLAPEADIAAVMSGYIEFEDAVMSVSGGPETGGFDVMAGRSGSGALAEANDEEFLQVAKAVVQFSTQYDQVVLDLGPGISTQVMRLARISDRTVFVVTNEPSAMTDVYAFMKVLKGYAPAVEQLLLLNKSHSDAAAKKVVKSIRQATNTFLGFRPRHLGTIPFDIDVENAALTQVPLSEHNPESAAYLAVIHSAKALLPIGISQTRNIERAERYQQTKPFKKVSISKASSMDDLVDVLSAIAPKIEF